MVASVFTVGVLLVGTFVVARSCRDAKPVSATWSRTTDSGSRHAGPALVRPAVREPINLHVFRTDGFTAVIGIAEGEVGHIGGAPNLPDIVLRPRRMGPRLLLEIARADGRPVTVRPAPGPFTVVLEPGVVVDIRNPFPFKVEWERRAQ